MSECIFCSIIRGETPSLRVFEDENHVAFLDIFPAALGHTLVVPKHHSTDIHEITAPEYGLLAERAKLIADVISEQLNTDGITIMQMNREAGWQSVFHTHIHVIPRFISDNLSQPWKPIVASQDDLKEIHSRIIHR
jgi:histidine triad (HIT) family protein